jgi:hypothetical protein
MRQMRYVVSKFPDLLNRLNHLSEFQNYYSQSIDNVRMGRKRNTHGRKQKCMQKFQKESEHVLNLAIDGQTVNRV